MRRRILVGILTVLFTWLWTGPLDHQICSQAAAGPTADVVVKVGVIPSLRVYFSPLGGCEKAIIQEIDQTKKTIDVAMYYFTSEPLAEALVRAEKRGVEVRVYLDESQKTGRYSKVKELLAGGCEVRFEGGPGLMHNKFCVIDDRVLITGSYNWTKAAEEKNDENILVILDEGLVKAFGKKFREYWEKYPYFP